MILFYIKLKNNGDRYMKYGKNVNCHNVTVTAPGGMETIVINKRRAVVSGGGGLHQTYPRLDLDGGPKMCTLPKFVQLCKHV